MRLRVAAATAALLAAALIGPAPAHAIPVDPADLQTLPTHLMERAYDNDLLSVSSDYVLHNVRSGPAFDGLNHFTILRATDGATVWSDFEGSPDAAARQLVGGYFVEKVGDATYWPDLVRFFDVETHALAGSIAVPDNETLFGIGPGWVLTSTPVSGFPGASLVIRRTNGTMTSLPDVPIDTIPRFSGFDGTTAWVHDGYFGPLFEIDVAAGTFTTVPKPEGMDWETVLVGPGAFFNIDDQYNGHVTVTEVDRLTHTAATYDLQMGLAGNAPRLMTRGDGLAAYHPKGALTGTLWAIDLVSGSLDGAIETDLSHALQMGPGKVAMVVSSAAPSRVAIDTGSGPAVVADLPLRREGVARIAYDGDVRVTWGDGTTWGLDPEDATPTWVKQQWTVDQNVTTSGGVTLVNDLAESSELTDQWHLTWPGGQRDVQGWGLRLGHGGELLVRYADNSGDQLVVERVRTGEIVATTGGFGAVADGSWVWTWATPTLLRGVDVDNPSAPVRTVAVSYAGAQPVIRDVRGRWIMLVAGSWTILDAAGVVAPWAVPGPSNNTGGAPASPVLGDGFLVWSRYTRDMNGINGWITSVADLTAQHNTRELFDPDTGKHPTWYRVDEAGGASVAYVDHQGVPKIARLPWLAQAPTSTDSTAPVTTLGALPTFSWAGSVRVSWNSTDPGSGVSGTDVRYRSAPWNAGFGVLKNLVTGSTSTSATLTVAPGSTSCVAARSRDVAGNVSTWTAERCTAVPADDSIAAKSSGWSRATSSAYYRGSTLMTKTQGSKLTLANVRARRIALVASTGPGNGKVEVYWRGARIGTWSLASATTVHRKLISLRSLPAVTTGTLVVKVVTAGKTVRVDGFALSQR